MVDHGQVCSEKDNLTLKLEQLTEQHVSVTVRCNEFQRDLIQKTQANDYQEVQYKEVANKLALQHQSLTELQSHYAVLSQECVILKNEIKETKEQNKILAHEKWELGQEKAQLQGQLKQMSQLLK